MATVLISLISITAIVVMAGQLGALEGSAPSTLGIQPGSQPPALAQPSSTPNSASSQTTLYSGHPQADYAAIDPLTLRPGETGLQGLARLESLLRGLPGVTVVSRTDHYLYAVARSRWLGFVDDVEFLVSDADGVIHVRSASRLGRKDFGVNRQRVEVIRERWERR